MEEGFVVLLAVLIGSGFLLKSFRDIDRSLSRRSRLDTRRPAELPGGGTTREDEVADVSVHIQLSARIGRTHTLLRARCLVPGALDLGTRDLRAQAILARLPEHVRDDLARRFARRARVRTQGGEVTMTYRGAFVNQEELDAAVVVVAEVARLGIDAVHVVRALPGAVYEAPRGPWDARTLACVRLPEYDVTFEARAREGVVHTAAWTELASAGAITEQDEAARRVGAASLRADGRRLTLTWAATESEPARLVAGAELLRRTAASWRGERFG